MAAAAAAAPPAIEVTRLLLHAQDPDPSVRTQAEQQIAYFQEQNYAGFLGSLAYELANGEKPPESRRLAGIVLKNNLDAKDDARKAALVTRWEGVDAGLRASIRAALLQALSMEPQEVRGTVALVVAKVAAIDLPRREWGELIPALMANMSATPPNHGVRQATLQALGYVCEEMAALKDDVLSPEQINMVLTAVVSGMSAEEPSSDTRLAAVTALQNAIEFADHNFGNENERNYIMQVVCQGTVASDPRIRVQSFTCLHEIAANYYGQLPPYMQEIFNLTVKAIKDDEEEVALQAIEFWSTLCDYELELEEEGEDADETNHGFIKAVTPHLVAVLLEQLTKQEEGQEQDESVWNAAMSAGTCLGLMARVAGNDVVPMVMPFVTGNISKQDGPEDWRWREAATFAFGSVVEGPSPSSLVALVQQALPFLLRAMKDPHPYVRDTTAWTIGRAFEFLHDSGNPDFPALVTQDNLPAIVQVLKEGLKDEIHIAKRVCDAIGMLAAGFAGSASTTSPLSPFFKEIATELLAMAQRSDPTSFHGSSSPHIHAYEAINELVRAAAADTLDVVGHLIPVFLNDIAKTFAMPASTPDQREKQAEMQGLLCGVVQTLCTRLAKEANGRAALLQYADGVMEALLRVMACAGAGAGGGGAGGASVHEEAMQAVGALAIGVGRQFSKYLSALYPYLKAGLVNHQEWQVCLATVGVLTDVVDAVGEDFGPYCDEVMGLLVHNLGSNEVHRSIKPQILSAFGDLALTLGANFGKYVDTVRRMLQQAMQLSVAQAAAAAHDDDAADYNNELRMGILEAYSGLFQGLPTAAAESQLKPDVPLILDFASSIARDRVYDELVVRAAVSLLADTTTTVQGVGGLLARCRGQDWERLLAWVHDSDGAGGELDWAVNAISGAVGSAS
ncbi:importin subunit beta-like [Raphidocelis subcapitata]|uniref:Importin subunit beta-like n=1 Tax=Raphidocelis subcapitata TaxID=307507 RepID=A0A2V0P928_9CHLO|nr:importin subunit beta-like [Raphidocelis subcapitata]|eukprot:GBF94393.1 importin subunit beta-like [Raphidocelis subcapitata]